MRAYLEPESERGRVIGRPPAGSVGSGRAAGPGRWALLAIVLTSGALLGCAEREELADLPAVDLAALAPRAQTQVAAAQAALAAATAESPVPLAARFGELGRQYQAYQLLAAAERSYRNALALTPDAFEWRYLLAHTLRQGNQYEAAAAAFEQAMALRPDYGAAQYWGAQCWSAFGKTEEAKKRFEALLEAQPKHAPAMVALAKLLQQEGDLERTVALLEQARQLDPAASEVNYPLGMAYRALGQEDKAAPLIEARGEVKTTLTDPVYAKIQELVAGAPAVVQSGNDAFKSGDAAGAEKAFRQAIAEDPSSVTARENLAVVLARGGRLDEAIQALQEAIALEPKRVSLHFTLGSLYTRQGKGDEAIGSLQQAIALDPAHANAHFNLGNALVRAGRPDEAQAAYRKVTELQPNNADARLLLSMGEIRAGRWPEAEREVVAAVTAVPDHPRLVEMLARLRAACPEDALRDGDEALALSERLMQSEANLNAAITQAMALAELGRFDEAVALQQEAIRAAKEAGRQDMEPSLNHFLAAYQAQQPARELWAPGDPLMPGVK